MSNKEHHWLLREGRTKENIVVLSLPFCGDGSSPRLLPKTHHASLCDLPHLMAILRTVLRDIFVTQGT
jgi:hypothetical protein